MNGRYKEGDLEFNVIYGLNEYADSHRDFNSKFLDGVMEFYEAQGYITVAQMNTLNKISYDILKKIEQNE